MAGARTAQALRAEGWTGAITLIGAERHPPYDRPPLSKAALLPPAPGGPAGPAKTTELGIDLAALGVELLLGRTVTALRPAERLVVTAPAGAPGGMGGAGDSPADGHDGPADPAGRAAPDGPPGPDITPGYDGPAGPPPGHGGPAALRYDHLVLATGADPIDLPGSAGAPGVHVLRTLDDAEGLRPVLAERREIVVVGAGWIGAEVTTAAREAGCPVTVVEAAAQPLAGALPAEVAAPMADWYEEAGARLLTGARVAAVEPGAVLLGDGTRLRADAVVVGIGARPATGWLAGSGVDLAPDGSVSADERLRTSLPDVYAAGDCASFPSARYGERLLVHHWDNAAQAPATVAAHIVRGPAATPAYDPVPYFWSEQFGRFLQYAGHRTGGERLLWRGGPAAPSGSPDEPGGSASRPGGWTVCWLRDGVLTALLAVGRPRDVAQGRRLIARGARLDPERAADPSVPLKSAAV
ncbi:NAD(P)/FAD-dependent oxidoreductase [Streptomyces zingiberis]